MCAIGAGGSEMAAGETSLAISIARDVSGGDGGIRTLGKEIIPTAV